MGKARQAPEPTWERQYYIGDSPVTKLREHVRNLCHLGPEEIRNTIDAAVRDAIREGCYEEIWDQGERAKVVDISEYFDDEQQTYALVKTNERSTSQWREAIIAIMGPSQVVKAKESERWTPYAEPPRQDSTPKLADSQAGKTLQLMSQVIPERPQKPTAPAPMNFETVLVTYRTHEGKTCYDEYLRVEVEQKIEELVLSGKMLPSTVDVWAKIPKKIKIEIG